MKTKLIFLGFISLIFVLAILMLPIILSLLGFILWGLTNSIPVYNEVLYIEVDFEKETEFNLLLPVMIQNNNTHNVTVGSIIGLVEDYSNSEENFTIKIITENVTIENQTILVTFLSIAGSASKIELYNEYHYRPENTVSYESNLFSTTVSGLKDESYFYQIKSMFYYKFGTNNQTSGDLYYFFYANTNFCSLGYGNSGNLNEFTEIDRYGYFLIEKSYSGENWENLSPQSGGACA